MSKFLDYASSCYYNGSPIISDDEFDRLAQQCNYNQVGYQVTDGIAHRFPMYSLQKYFNLEDAPALSGYMCTPKLDGAAISLLYVDGHLALALTRGDGKIGRDITDKARLLVPETITLLGSVQITGEVVCPKTVENARNVASGSLNLKDINEFTSRLPTLTFVAYGIQEPLTEYWSRDMLNIAKEGFHTVDTFDATNYPTDGLVYRLDNNDTFEELGYTAHHPRGAFALKEQKEGVVTTLLNVEWQVGKSGVVSPVGVLEPVQIGDAIVAKATLHNIEYIRELNLEIGCMVEVIRSGEIIPRIVRRVNI